MKKPGLRFFTKTASPSRPEPKVIEKPQPHVIGYDRYVRSNATGRALLSYLVQPVRDELEGRTTTRFSSDGIVLGWVRALNELGYVVDVINWDDTTFEIEEQYDVLMFHGALNFEHLQKSWDQFDHTIYFSTGSYWKFHNQHEDARFSDFKKRHGVELKRDRYIDTPEEDANKAVDAIIALGDASMATTYPFKNVMTINNCSFPDDHFDKTPKDYEATKNNFLYFAGSGNIHKGLDLLIDSFTDLDQHLYMVGRLDEDVLDVFKKELKRPNFHVVGEVNMRTTEFYDAMDACAFAILPSCSEGQAGSVVECMNQGLVPIVSEETRLDARGYGFVLEDCSIAQIQETVKHAASLPTKEVQKLSKATRRTAQQFHSPEHFNKTAVQHLKAIIGR